MRARELDTDPFAGARFGVENGLVGIGERVSPAPESPEEAAEILAVSLGPKAGRMLQRFAALPEGAFVWTRTDEDSYRLGRISGSWRYDDSDTARRVGIHHIRMTRWREALSSTEAPAGVVHTFDRGGRNLQRIHDEDAERLTIELWRAGPGS